MSTEHGEFAAHLDELHEQLRQQALAGLHLVSLADAHLVLRHYGRPLGTAEAGSFFTRLVAAVAAADQLNRRRLAFVYPGLVAAAQLIEHHPSGIALLQVAGGISECQTCHGLGMVKSAEVTKLTDADGGYLAFCGPCHAAGWFRIPSQ